ncbi:hypothetical protein ES703_81171 [subsurface metagenome]
MVGRVYKNNNKDEVLKKIIDKLVEYDQSLRKIKSYLNRIDLFVKSEAFVRDFKLLDKEMLKARKLWDIPVEIKVDKNRKNLFNKINYLLKYIYIKVIFFFLKPFKNRMIANNLAFMSALKYLVDSHKKLISDIDNFSKKNVELLTEINRSIVGISEQQDYILNMIVDDKKKEKQGIN